MTNSYVSLDVFKGEGVMNIVGDGGDGRLLSLLEGVSRMVDRYCNRHFYVLEAPRRFDGDGENAVAAAGPGEHRRGRGEDG